MKIDNPQSAQVSTEAAKQSGGVTENQTGSGGRGRIDGHPDRVQLSNLSSALLDLSGDDPVVVRRLAGLVGSHDLCHQALHRALMVFIGAVDVEEP